MLVLTRKLGEKIVIDGNITITVVDAGGGKVRLGIDAPPHITILRQELVGDWHEETIAAAAPVPASPVLAGAHATPRRFTTGGAQLRSLRQIPR